MKAFVLFVVAALLFAVFAPFGTLTVVVMMFIVDSRERYTKLTDLFYALAYCIDLLGNVICGELFNITLARHGCYQFGYGGETISSALGKNMIDQFKWRSKSVTIKYFKITCTFKKFSIKVFKAERTFTFNYKYCHMLTGMGNVIANTLDSIDNNHCIKSIQRLW